MVEGEWWRADYAGPPLVSMEKKIADGLGLKLGDEIVVNVLGRDITAKIANLRTIDWQGMGINFVLVFSPNAFKGAPHTHIATLTEAGGTAAGDAKIIKAGRRRLSDGDERARARGDGDGRLGRDQSGARDPRRQRGDPDLGDPGAGRRARRRPPPPGLRCGDPEDARRDPARLLGAYALEYLLIGLATAVFGVIAGSVAAWMIVTRLMTLSFVWQAGSAAGVVAAALVVTVGLGLAGTLLALNKKPATVLRNL